LLLDRVDGELTPEQAKQIHFLLRSADGLSEMVTELLDSAKIEAGKTEVKLALVAVGEVFSALRGMFRPLSLNNRLKRAESGSGRSCTIREAHRCWPDGASMAPEINNPLEALTNLVYLISTSKTLSAEDRGDLPPFAQPFITGVFSVVTRPAYLSQKSLDISACMVRFGPC